MKTYGNLFDKIVSKENISNAIIVASKHKRKRRDVKKCLQNRDEIAERLSNELKNGTWRPLKIHNAVEINDGVALKKRIIVCPSFEREHIVHHAIMLQCNKLFMSKFYYHSYGSIPKKGKEALIKYVRKQLKDRRKTKYYCKLDVTKFFATVKPSVSFKALRWVIRDRKVLGLFALILRNNFLKESDGTIKRTGLPIGFYISPWIANLVLSKIDHMAKEKYGINVYGRYIDDIILFHSNKRQLQKAVDGILAELSKIDLKIKTKPVIHILDKQPLTYIGFTITHDKIVLRPLTFLKCKRAISRMSKKDKITAYDAMHAISIKALFDSADCHGAYNKYISPYISIIMCRYIVSRKDRLVHELRMEKINI